MTASRGEIRPAGTPPLATVDRMLTAFLALFAFTSFAMEPYIMLHTDLANATDPLGRAWYFYARSWDPLFLDPPFYMRVMTGIDACIYGPTYLVLIYAILRRRAWIRAPALLYCGAILYSTLVYFLVEFLTEAHRANLLMVVVVNVPYTIIPCVLAWRMWPSASSGRNPEAGSMELATGHAGRSS
jgi:hypothetical protein